MGGSMYINWRRNDDMVLCRSENKHHVCSYKPTSSMKGRIEVINILEMLRWQRPNMNLHLSSFLGTVKAETLSPGGIL